MNKLAAVLVAFMFTLGYSYAEDLAEDTTSEEDLAEEKSNGQARELKLGAEFVSPGFDVWDSGSGVEAKMIFWQDEKVGLAASIGYQGWDVTDEVGGAWLTDEVVWLFRYDGDASMIPLGLSGVYRHAFNEKTKLVAEGGIRYVIVNSDVQLQEVVTDGSVAVGRVTDIDIDDGIVGFVGVDLEHALKSGLRLFAGLSAQFDLSKGDVSTVYGAGENELEATIFRVGAAWDM